MARTATIRIEGRYAWLSMSPSKRAVKDDLEQAFTWVNPSDLADSKEYYARRSGQMLHGLAWKAKEILERHNYKVRCEMPKVPAHKKAEHWKITKPPRSVNQKLLADAVDEGLWGSFVGPPAIGKTYILAYLAAAARNTTLIVSYQRKPNAQVAEAFSKFTNFADDVIRLDANNSVPDGYVLNGPKVIVATIQKLAAMRRRKDPFYRQIVKKTKLLLFDEAHHAKADGGIMLLEDLDRLVSCGGVTATWKTTDGKEIQLEGVVGPIRAQVKLEDAIDEGDVCPTTLHVATVPPRYYFMEDPKDARKRKKAEKQDLGGGMTAGAVLDASEEPEVDRFTRLQQFLFVERDYVINGSTGRNEIIASFVERMRRKGRTGVIIINRLDHAVELCKIIPGLVPLLASKVGDIKPVKGEVRDALIHKLEHRHKDCDWVVSTTFDEAVNVPTLDCVVLAASGKSDIKLEQRMRNTRSFNGDLETGYYCKRRGHTLLLRDQCDFLGSHAKTNLANMRRILQAHPANKEETFNDTIPSISPSSWSPQRAAKAFRKWQASNPRKPRRAKKRTGWG